jgi:hypothetical protein
VRKGILWLMALCCILSGTVHAKIQRYTADFYKIRAEEYLNKSVGLDAFSARLADPAPISQTGYRLIEVKTIYNDQHGGSMLIAVPTDAVIAFKDKYSVLIEDAVKLSGILRRSADDKRQLYLEFGEGPSTQHSIELRKKKKKKGTTETAQYSSDYYELLAEKYLGHKITLPAISASLDKSDRLDHIKNTRAFIVETTNQKIPNGRIAVVVPNDYVPSFAKSFLTRTEIEPRNLSGYLYKCKTRNSSFLYLYCSHTPMKVTRRKSSAPDPLHELVSTYIDLDDNGRVQLIDLARKLNPPE